MLTIRYEGNNVSYYALSTDTKPEFIEKITGKQELIPNGSTLYEIDTKKVYMFDIENLAWIEQ